MLADVGPGIRHPVLGPDSNISPVQIPAVATFST